MIEVESKDDIAILLIDNPPMNVLCTKLLKELDEALDELESINPKAVVITGKGKAFVAGADIKEMIDMSPEEARDYSELGQGVLDKIEHFPVPVIAAVNGFALGGGTEVAAACDIRIASKNAKFGQPEVNLGVIPGFGGTQRLARLVGLGDAKYLIFTGKIIGAQQGHDIGLIQEIVPDDNRKDSDTESDKVNQIQKYRAVVSRAVDIAEEISTKGPIAIKKAKSIINKGMDGTLDNGQRLERKGFSELFSTEDQKEGMKAFIEKRKPEFKDK